MNNRLSLEFGQDLRAGPGSKKSPYIRNADALETCCRSMSARTSAGNPPFGEADLQSLEQGAQVRRVAALSSSGGTLDYVTAWVHPRRGLRQTQPDGGTPPGIGFAATNSFT